MLLPRSDETDFTLVRLNGLLGTLGEMLNNGFRIDLVLSTRSLYFASILLTRLLGIMGQMCDVSTIMF